MHVRTTTALSGILFAAPAFAQQFQEETSTRFPTPTLAEYTNYVEVGDIDGDGDLDLVFANGGNFSSPGPQQLVRIYINDGDASFTDESIARTGTLVGNFRGAALGDVDGDDDLDLLLASDFNRLPRLLINDGDGFFTDETFTRLPIINLSATRGQFADIDNDGDLDIYINNGGTTNRFGCGLNRIYTNNGSGVFTDETLARHPLSTVCEPMDVIFGDIDNDFDLDVRTGNRGTNNSKLYFNNGNGVFVDGSQGVPADSACYSYDFGDFNGDGKLDLLGANAGPSNSELLALNNGNGTYTDASARLVPNGTGDDNDSKFFDLDNDGDLDLIIAALYQSREKIYLNDGTGEFTLDSGRITGANDASLDVAVADFDGDGDFDIVTAQGESGSTPNRIYINTTGPADTIPPNVTAEVLPDTENTSRYIVRARAYDGVTSDRGFYDKGVALLYTVDGGSEVAVSMRWSGNSLWRGEIPGQSPGSEIAYRVTAVDFAGNTGESATHSFMVLGTDLPGDVDGDGDVDFEDLLALLAEWGPCIGCPADFNGDDEVGFEDLLVVLANWTL